MASPLPHREARSTVRKDMADSTRLTLLEGDADTMESKLSIGLGDVHAKLTGVGKKQDKMIKLLWGALITFTSAALLLLLQLAAG